jgi:hypothetical protein
LQQEFNTEVDSIFMNCTRFSSTSVSPVANGLSGHDTQYLVINNVTAAGKLISSKQRTRKVNNETIILFQLLKVKIWESVYKDSDISNNFNSFLIRF